MRKLTREWRPWEIEDVTKSIFKIKNLIRCGPRSGFSRLDQRIGGVWRDGVVISGSPGAGKSLLVSHLALRFVIGGHVVILVDLENDLKDVHERLFLIFLSSMAAKKAPTKGQFHDAPEMVLTDPKWIRAFQDHIANRLWIIDSGHDKAMTPAHLEELVREEWEKVTQEEKQVVLIIDSVNELNSLWPLGKSEYESIQRWLSEIKHIKSKYEIPVILVCHVTQEGQGFKGTSGLRHFGRTQILLESGDKENTRNDIILTIQRSQYGQTGDTPFHLDRTRLMLEEIGQ